MLVLGNPAPSHWGHDPKFPLLDSRDMEGIAKFVSKYTSSASLRDIKADIREILRGKAARGAGVSTAAAKQAMEYAAIVYDRRQRGDVETTGSEIEALFTGPARTKGRRRNGKIHGVDREGFLIDRIYMAIEEDKPDEAWHFFQKLEEQYGPNDEVKQHIDMGFSRGPSKRRGGREFRRRNSLGRCESAFLRGHVAGHEEDMRRFGRGRNPSLPGPEWTADPIPVEEAIERGKSMGWVRIYGGGKTPSDEAKIVEVIKKLGEKGFATNADERGAWVYIGPVSEYDADPVQADRLWRQALNEVYLVLDRESGLGTEKMSAKEKKALQKRFTKYRSEMVSAVDTETARLEREMREQAAREKMQKLLETYGTKEGNFSVNVNFTIPIYEDPFPPFARRRSSREDAIEWLKGEVIFVRDRLMDAGYRSTSARDFEEYQEFGFMGWRTWWRVADKSELDPPTADKVEELERRVNEVERITAEAKSEYISSHPFPSSPAAKHKPPSPQRFVREGRETWGIPLEPGDLE